MSEKLKRGARVTGVDRSKLAAALAKRYETGESIRALAASTGRSYSFVQRLLAETGVRLRGRGGPARVKGGYSRDATSDMDQLQISVQIFLADAEPGPAVEEAVREVLADIAYHKDQSVGITVYAIDNKGGHYVGCVYNLSDDHKPYYYMASGSDTTTAQYPANNLVGSL